MSGETDIDKKIKNLKLNNSDINILLLGETGVGKSTFINSIANYLTYTDLNKAEKENLLVLIPTNYTVKDKQGDYHNVQVGSSDDKNEFLDAGVSATQDVKTYVFPIWGGKTKIRLIDTPGMGDTRGIEQDHTNCENILSYIGQLHELHAICFLFKPTNARITKFFEYCMSQILSRLDKSASKNLIFIFTNTRGTDYGPGETFPILQKVVKDIKDRPPFVDIPLNRNVFCFDNESFRYLAAVKENVEFDNSLRSINRESWKKSVDQCWRLIKYIVGDAENPPLKPHHVKSTSAVNEARRLIIQLSQPLAEISQVINDNLQVLRRHEQHLNLDHTSLEDLKKKLYMPVINLEVTTLTQPVTVCTSSGCAEVYKVGEKNKWHYKQKCHDPCFLTNVPKEIIGSPELVNCAAMNKSTKMCIKCGCDFSIHMHIYYMTKTKEDRIIDRNIQKNIDSKEKILENAKKLVDEITKKQKELEKEHGVIVTCCARFAHFLQNNAITPFSDSYKEYILYLINREKSLGASSDMSEVHHLNRLLAEYEEAKTSFDEALKLQKKIGGGDVFVSPQKITESIEELYKLKHNGEKIKELYNCQKKSRSKEHQNTEYVHKLITKQEKSDQPEQKKPFKKGEQSKNKSGEEGKQHKGKVFKNQNQQKHQQPERSRTPPPSYHEIPPAQRNYPSGRDNYPPSPHNYPSQQYYPPPPPPSHGAYPPPPARGAYPPPPPHGGYPPPPPHGAYPPPPHHSGYYPPPNSGYPPRPQDHRPYDEGASARYHRSDSRDDRQESRGTKYELKVIIDKSDEKASKDSYPPRDPYVPPKDNYSAGDSYYPPRDHYSPRDNYPPRDPYPPRDNYPPRDHYPHHGDPYYSPYPEYPHHRAQGPPPQRMYQQYGGAPPGESQQQPSSFKGRGQGRGGNKYDSRGRGRGRGRANSRPRHHKKKNPESGTNDSDEFSDSSVASSKKSFTVGGGTLQSKESSYVTLQNTESSGKKQENTETTQVKPKKNMFSVFSKLFTSISEGIV